MNMKYSLLTFKFQLVHVKSTCFSVKCSVFQTTAAFNEPTNFKFLTTREKQHDYIYYHCLRTQQLTATTAQP